MPGGLEPSCTLTVGVDTCAQILERIASEQAEIRIEDRASREQGDDRADGEERHQRYAHPSAPSDGATRGRPRPERSEEPDVSDRDGRPEHGAEEARASRRPFGAPSDRRARRGRLAGSNQRPDEPRDARVDRRVGQKREPRSGHDDRSGTIRSIASITESTTSTAQQPAASAASAVTPETAKHATMSSAETASTSGYVREIRVSQCRQRPGAARTKRAGRCRATGSRSRSSA